MHFQIFSLVRETVNDVDHGNDVCRKGAQKSFRMDQHGGLGRSDDCDEPSFPSKTSNVLTEEVAMMDRKREENH